MYYSNDTIGLVLADRSAFVRAGIRRMLGGAPEFRIVAECEDAESTMAAVREFHPDVVILDFYLGAGSAVEVLQTCGTLSPRPVCVVLTEHTQPGIRAIAYAAGADVFYDKRDDLARLLGMLRKLAPSLRPGDEFAAA